MTGSEMVLEMESLLLAKLEAQEQCLRYYELIDESVRKELLIKTFETIDALCDDIQKLDILFVSKLDSYKSVYGIKDLGELGDAARLVFTIVKKQVLKAAENDGALSDFKQKTAELKMELKRDKMTGSQIKAAASAYNKINKL